MRHLCPLLLCLVLFSCAVSKDYDPDKKYSKETLREDYTFLRTVLEKKHPALYWYTPKDSMDRIFDLGYQAISDSMTELKFGWNILAPLTTAIHCGHTSFSMSKHWNKFMRNKRIPSFPLYLKIWDDTMVVVNNLNKSDSILKKGTLITSVNGLSTRQMLNTMFDFMVKDGYSNNVNYIRLSASFPYFHRNIFGLYKNYDVGYMDSLGRAGHVVIPFYTPPVDSLKKKKLTTPGIKPKKIGRQERLENIRSLQVDSGLAVMTVNSFSKSHLHRFFQKSFRKLRKEKIKNLVIDIRANGGGDINNYVLLTKYISRTPFRVADTAYAISRNFRPFTSSVSSGFFENLALIFITKKQRDGKYHFRFWERHTFRPKRKNHFAGDVYVLTNGLTFSASSLFCNAVKGQEHVTLVGEETGGGWYGNSGIMIPDVTLPNTRLRVRLPFFRLVQYNHVDVKGTGVYPDIYVGPNVHDVVNQVDTKMEKVKALIAEETMNNSSPN